MTCKYSIVIPTYNHCDDLLRPCVESLLKYSNISELELIISANGCTDSTQQYLAMLKDTFEYMGLEGNLKIVVNDKPLGYAKACNVGIEVATCDLVVLLNNDTVLLTQAKNQWLNTLERPFTDPDCGISCIIKDHSECAGHDFAVFFCVMIHKKVFNKIGLLPLDYGVGGGEDTEFCIECERAGFKVLECLDKVWNTNIGMFSGGVPIYHRGEGTVFDKTLVPDWGGIFKANMLKLAKKYNPTWYIHSLMNNFERAIFLKGDTVYEREATRYNWAGQHVVGKKVLEIGCSNGYGVQFLPKEIDYLGVDYDRTIIEVAKEQNWGAQYKFQWADINQFELGYYDTIIAFEVIEHLANGIEVVEKLKQHCDRLLITVPYKEPPGFWGEHHLLHHLDESYFPDFEFKYINEHGVILDAPDNSLFHLMLCKHDKK